MHRTFRYRGKEYPIMTLEAATAERDNQEAKGNERHIIATKYHGGFKGDYVVVEVPKKPPRESEEG
jgi:hypothetical protein